MTAVKTSRRPPTRAAWKREASPDGREDALLDAAAAEFGEKGFHDSSIVSITARAGVALGTFYTYFDSKDELFRALVS
ncbi:MAG TPA: TetR/AcrR family transcriptional regulator, partial [Nevskiaceae bacterium]|nr:TetR/AcrR family transcriptional regulator [Nevskiaceae bacterium]